MNKFLKDLEEIKLKMDGIASTASCISKAMTSKNEYYPVINLLAENINDVQLKVYNLADEGKKLFKND